MNTKFFLKNLASLDDLILFNNFESTGKISVLQIDPFNYCLFVHFIWSSRISLIKLSLKDIICNFNDDFALVSGGSASEMKPIEIYLVNIFHLPFNLLTVVCTKKSVWAIGQETVVNLKPYVEQSLEKEKLYENDDMDVDIIEEFQPNMFDIQIDISNLERYNFHSNDIFIDCNFLEYALIQCHKNSRLCVWELDLFHPNDRMMSSDVMTLSFLNFPVSYNKKFLSDATNQDQNETFQPLIVFVHHDDPESHMLRNLFDINCSSPNVICLIGHPDGKLLCSVCDFGNQLLPSHELQALFDIRQPIVGIFFIKNIKGLEDCDCMLLVGAMGQLTLISSKRYPAFTQEPGVYPFWTKTSHLSSSVAFCDVVKDCLLCILNDGILSLSNLSVIFHPSDEVEQLITAPESSEFECIDQMIIADRNQGLIFLKTKYGSIYLTQLRNDMGSGSATLSLPSLMNDCLKQSNKMQILLNKKALQSRLFATVSTFASLKFLKNILRESVTFSISEVNEELRKYILVINLKCLDNLNLDAELCYVTATVFTFFKNNNSLLTKTAPYEADEPTLCLEFTDTILQPAFVSIFPLFVEVGLILQLPEKWKTVDCFKTVSNFLPLYIRIQTFMVHELNLLQNNALCFPQSLKLEIPKILKMLKELGMKRPVSNIPEIVPKQDFNILKKFDLCLSVSSAEEMLKNTCDSDPCKYIEKILLGNIIESSMFKESYLVSKSSPLSINVSKNNSHIVINLTANNSDSLLGLRIAVMEILLATHRMSEHSTSSSTYVNIPASIYRRCEEISKSLMSLYGKDVGSGEVSDRIIHLYKELRTDVSAKLPIL